MMKEALFLLVFTAKLLSCSSNKADNNNLDYIIDEISVLDSCNFDNSEFSLYVVSEQFNKGEDICLYTKDKSILNHFKKTWIVNKLSFCRCTPEYMLYFENNGSVNLSIGVSKVINDIFIGKEQYKFNSDTLFFKYLTLFNPLYKYSVDFNSLEERINYISKIDTNQIVLSGITNSNKLKFKYLYRFNYLEEIRDTTDPWSNSSVEILYLYKIIETEYPNEQFWLETSDLSISKESKMISKQIDLYCNKSLFVKFDLFKRVENFKTKPIQLIFFSKSNI